MILDTTRLNISVCIQSIIFKVFVMFFKQQFISQVYVILGQKHIDVRSLSQHSPIHQYVNFVDYCALGSKWDTLILYLVQECACVYVRLPLKGKSRVRNDYIVNTLHVYFLSIFIREINIEIFYKFYFQLTYFLMFLHTKVCYIL